jgi:peptidoglycan/xylan/chitin deacetylase (PgdA/CDA1 family)
MTPFKLRVLKRSIEKTLPDFAALFLRRYPKFVFRSFPYSLTEEIPVFTFHRVEAECFEGQLRFLARNGYYTATADELATVLRGDAPLPASKTILLTFDDGHRSLWTIAFPLLKKYGLRAVGFVTPGWIEEGESRRFTLEDVWTGQCTPADLIRQETQSSWLCSWQEIEAMHRSGVIDFQSHTLYHNYVAISPRIVDFLHPGYDVNFCANIPVPTCRGEDGKEHVLPWGAPVFESAPRMVTRSRYFDSPVVRERCAALVTRAGGNRFFADPEWRRILRKTVDTCLMETRAARYETPAECEQAVREDLLKSKYILEERLGGKTVRHLCYPWYAGSELAATASRDIGYVTNFWGVLPRRTNRRGDDPFRIVRVDEAYLQTLPGEGRKSLSRILWEKRVVKIADTGGSRRAVQRREHE